MKFEIVQEKRGEVEAVMQEFRNELSERQILIGTAQGINAALTKGKARINRVIKQAYNIRPKYLSRVSAVSPKANSSTLWGGIRVSEGRIPVYAFRPRQTGSHISVAVHKGRTVIIRNSFIATMASGHTGVFSRGKYVRGQGFVPGKERSRGGKIRITQIMTASPFTMGISPNVQTDVAEFIGREVIARVHGILTSRVAKIAQEKDK